MVLADDPELRDADADDIVLLRDISLDHNGILHRDVPELSRGGSSVSKSGKTVRINSSPLSRRIRHFSDNLALMHSSFSSRTSSAPDAAEPEDEQTHFNAFKNILGKAFRFCFAADSFENDWGKLRFMRFYAAAEDLFLLNACCSGLSVFGIIVCLFFRTPKAGWIFIAQIVVFFLSLGFLHVVRKWNLLSPETSLTLWSSFSTAQLLVQPSALHIVLGGFSKGVAADILVWTMFSPAVVFLSKFDAAHKLEPHNAANWEAHVLAHTTFLLASGVRFTVTVILAIFDGSFSQPAPEFLWAHGVHVINFINIICCPLLLIGLSRVSRSDFIDRRATFLKVTDAVHFQQVRIEKLVHSMVPAFHVQELRDKPTDKWWQSPPVDFHNCTILQMDIAGFTYLSSKMEAEELIDLLNAVYTQIDQAAEYIGQIWKVETIGDCYIAVAGGPLECRDHATRAVTLGLCILDIADKISAIAQVPINLRVGIHSGSITVAGFGALMPRCLIFGKDPQIARVLEAAGEYNCVHVSEHTLAELESQPQLNARLHDQVEELVPCNMRSYTLPMAESLSWWRRVGAQFDGLLHFHRDLNRMSEVAREKEGEAPGMSYVRQLSTLSSSFSGSMGSSKTDSVFSEMKPLASPKPASPKPGGVSRGGVGREKSRDCLLRSQALSGSGRELSGSCRDFSGLAFDIDCVPEESEACSQHITEEEHLKQTQQHRKLEDAPKCESLERVVKEDSVYPIVQSVLEGGLARIQSEGCPVSEKQAAMVRCNEGGWLTHRAPNLEQASAKANLLLCERRRRVGGHMLLVAAITALLQAATLLLCPLLPAPRTCLQPPPASSYSCPPNTLYQVLAIIPLCFGGGVLWLLRHIREEARRWCQAGDGDDEECRPDRWDKMTDWALLLSPLAFLGALDGAYCSAALMWGAATAVLRGTFDHHDIRRWAQWFGAYVAMVGVIVLSLRTQRAGWNAGDSGWKLFLHCVHILVPTSLFLVPGISCSCQMMSDDRCSEMLLEQNLKTTIREKELLEALVPKAISRRLRKGERHIADRYEEASVCFVYLAELQHMLQTQDNTQVLHWINAVQVAMDHALQKGFDVTQVSKVETFQDFYMIVCGCPVERADHSELIIDVAAALSDVAVRIVRPDGKPTAIKVGVSSGPLCAGVIGERSPRWSVFGDTVNTASRMASNALCSLPDKTNLHISSSTVRSLSPDFLQRIEQVYKLKLAKRGDGMDIKGKGFMHTFFLATPAAALRLDANGNTRAKCGAVTE